MSDIWRSAFREWYAHEFQASRGLTALGVVRLAIGLAMTFAYLRYRDPAIRGRLRQLGYILASIWQVARPHWHPLTSLLLRQIFLFMFFFESMKFLCGDYGEHGVEESLEERKASEHD